MNIGDKIFNLRKSKGYSQEDIANKLNVSRQTVSKWETNQSMPDFDKIVPLCDIFGISTDEFLKDNIVSNEKEEVKDIVEDKNINDLEEREDDKRKFAFRLCVSIGLYFLSVMWVIFAETLDIPEELSTSIFLGIVGVATVIIVYASMTKKHIEEKKKIDENKKVKTINNILSLIFFAFYMIISFMTMAWHITWIIWIIYAVVSEIVKAIYELGGKNE